MQHQLPIEAAPNFKVLIVYHGDCMDGATAAALLRVAVTEGKVLGRKVSLPNIDCIGVLPATTPSAAFNPEVSDVLFVDTCPTRGDWMRLVARLKNVLIWDHHQTSDASIPGAVIDMHECAASLVFRTFWPHDEVLSMVRYIRDVDLFENLLPDTMAVRMVLQEVRTPVDARLLLATFEDSFATIRARGEMLYQAHKARVDVHVGKAAQMQLIGAGAVKVMAVRVDERGLASDVANELARLHGCIGVAFRGAGMGTVYTLRSVPGSSIDVGRIAQGFGGGGHKHAAGFASAGPVPA